MATLRIAFLSAFALELAASLGTAVVAVELGIRLVDGSIALSPALAILVLAPELYAPLRTASAQFHASADGLAAAGRLFELIDLEAPSRPARRCPRAAGALRLAARRAVVVPGAGRRPGRRRPRAVSPASASRSSGRAARASRRSSRCSCASSKRTTAEHRRRRRSRDGRPRRLAAALAWVPQRPLLEPGTVAEAVRLGAPRRRLRGRRPRSRAAGLAVRLDADVPTLSAGEQRRVAFARALASRGAAAAARRADRAPRRSVGRSGSSTARGAAAHASGARRDARPARAARRPTACSSCAAAGCARSSRSGRPHERAAPSRAGAPLAPFRTPCAAAGAGAGAALLATSGYLISRAATRPDILSLTVVIVGVRFFALARAVLRYLERLVSHDASFRFLSRVRVRVLQRGSSRWCRARSAARGPATCSAASSPTSTRCSTCSCACIAPPIAALVVGRRRCRRGAARAPAGRARARRVLVFGAVVVPLAVVGLARTAAARRRPAERAVVAERRRRPARRAARARRLRRGRRPAGTARATRTRRSGAPRRGAGARDWGGGRRACWRSPVSRRPLWSRPRSRGHRRADGVMLGLLALLTLAVFEGVRALPLAAEHLVAAEAAAGRLIELTGHEPSVVDPPVPRAPERRRSLRSKVRVRYALTALGAGGSTSTLRPGRRIALLGPSGCGEDDARPPARAVSATPTTDASRFGGARPA